MPAAIATSVATNREGQMAAWNATTLEQIDKFDMSTLSRPELGALDFADIRRPLETIIDIVRQISQLPDMSLSSSFASAATGYDER